MPPLKSALELSREMQRRSGRSNRIVRSTESRSQDIAPAVLNSEALQALSREDLLDRFLSDSSIPAGIFYSRALDRRFVFARNEAALEALTEADEGLPVLFFNEAEKLSRLGLEGLRVALDLREAFGPAVVLQKVSPRRPTEEDQQP